MRPITFFREFVSTNNESLPFHVYMFLVFRARQTIVGSMVGDIVDQYYNYHKKFGHLYISNVFSMPLFIFIESETNLVADFFYSFHAFNSSTKAKERVRNGSKSGCLAAAGFRGAL